MTTPGPYDASLAILDQKLRNGEITQFEYDSARRAVLRGETPDALTRQPPKQERPPEIVMPPGWSTQPSGVKLWTADGRPDDPSRRFIYPPTQSGIGNGKAFFFLFGFVVTSQRDQEFLQAELKEIEDDIAVLRNAGYTVVVDHQATKRDFLETLYAQGEGVPGVHPVGIYWSGHGNEDGGVETCDGGVVLPSDVDTTKVSPALRLLILASCYAGCRARTWRMQLGGTPLIVGWGHPVTIDRAVEFLKQRPETDTDLDDLIRRYILTDSPLPPEPSRDGLVEEAAARGWCGDVPDRIRNVALRLGAMWKVEQRKVLLHIPLEKGRHQIVSVFLIYATEPFVSGEILIGVESEAGALTSVVDPSMLLRGRGSPSYARVALVTGPNDAPRMLAQGFLPAARATESDLTALIYDVANTADAIEQRVFGSDMR
ncbi:MAG: hypothetical protein U0165_12250 [Polyangiaceae bacterium]